MSTVSDPQELERVEAELRAVRISEASQHAILANTRGLMRAKPERQRQPWKNWSRKETNMAMYEQLVARGGQAEVSKQLEVQDKSTTFRIVEPAVMPSSPVSPNRVKIMLMGIVAGFAGGFSPAFAHRLLR